MNNDNLQELRERLLREDNVQHMIRVRAYEIYRMRGAQPGAPSGDWFQAESEVLSFLLANESQRLDESASDKARVASDSEHEKKPVARKKTKSSSASTAPRALERTRTKPTGKRVASKKTTESAIKPKRVRKKKEREKDD
jgi:DUF2934 family protein